MKRIPFFVVAFIVISLPAQAVPITVNIAQLNQSTFGLQSASDGSFEQISPDATSYVINDDFKFFVPDEPFLGNAFGLIDSVIGIGNQGCSASDFSGFTPGSIALMRNTICVFSDQVNLAFNAGAIGAIISHTPALGSGDFGLSDPVSVPSIIITRDLGDTLQAQLQAPVPEPSTVPIDIKPSSDPNSINLKSRGVLPVAILTTDEFDALQVDLASIVFGDPVLLDDGGIGITPLRSAQEDVNDDGLIDLTLKFSMPDLVDNGALGGMSMEAILTGLTFDGMMFEASDSIRLVPPGDANNDQIVDAVDYAIWADGFGGPNPELSTGDYDGDGSTDGVDYAIWADNFGMSAMATSSAPAAVPEPSTFGLSALGLIGLLAYEWRRRRRA